MTLEKFMGMEKPWEYNFEWECEKLQELETFERYFSYKATGIKLSSPEKLVYPEAEDFIVMCQNKYRVPDCDNCDSVSQIYSALWGDINWRGDTMNSVHKRIVDLISTFKDDEKAVLKGRADSRRYLTQCFCGEHSESFKRRLKGTKYLSDYIDVYHTLGNFVLVPKGFNTKRAGLCNDYWDKSLAHLKLNDFGDYKCKNFSKYINCFFLWDYVDIVDGSYMERNISPHNINDIEQYKDFFKETVRIIRRRGMFMTAMLMLKQDDYHKLQKSIFDTSKIYDGFDSVISEIEKEISLNGSTKVIMDGLKNKEGYNGYR